MIKIGQHLTKLQ